MHYLIRKSILILAIALTACGPTTTPTLSPTVQPTATIEVTPLILGNWHDMIYDKKMGQVVLVNGGPENGKASSELVELWNWDGDQWSLLSADSNGPLWRNFANITYNSKRQVLVLYGGLTAEQEFSDTWEWDGETWTQFMVAGPGPRESAAMTYDSRRDKVILFGGVKSGKMMNDLWEWDGKQWTNIASTGPPPRFPAGFVYDAAHQNVLLFGGHTYDNQRFTTYDDTWLWAGTQWQEIELEGPSARDGARAIFIPSSDQILLFGGAEIDTNVTYLNDMWLWDSAQWTKIDVKSPPARAHPAMAFDELRGVAVMSGGSNGPNVILADTWEWDGQAWVCADHCE